MPPRELGVIDLLAAASLVVAAVAALRAHRVEGAWTMAWGGVRTAVQLLVVGAVLRWIFAAELWLWVALAFAVMLTVATVTASRRVQRPIPGLWPPMALALSIGSGATTLAVTALIVRADPWWDARYFLPLAGMIVGNAMNAAALAAERLQAEITARKEVIEELLALGAAPRQAVDDALRAALRAALVPTINAMLTVGLVSLPGMMTGQIVAGAEAGVAAGYQILVMFMLAGATTASAVILGRLVAPRFFTTAWQLRHELL